MPIAEPSEIPEEVPFSSGPLSPPKDDEEWRRALVDVKWLCLNQQYKQCYSRCHQLIETASDPLDPIRATYLHYYAAASYEYLGRAAHIFSSAKLPFLNSALAEFEAASAALPAELPQPVLNAPQSYSPLSTDPYSRSQSIPLDLSPIGSTWSASLPALRGEDETVPDVEDVSPSFHIWTPITYSPPSNSSPNPSSAALPYQRTGPFETPPRPKEVCPNFTPLSGSTVPTAFCVTPPLSSGRTPRPTFDARAAVFGIPRPTRAPPPPPDVSSPSPSIGDKLVSFDSDGRRPTGGNIVKHIARMINSSLLNDLGDPFVSREKPVVLRTPMRPPVRLSPIKFPTGFEDPVKQIKLLPSPLQIRKDSGDMLKCGGPGVVIRKGSIEQGDPEGDIKRLVRSRPPRLPLKIIPSNDQTTNTGKAKSPILAPQTKHLGLLASSSPSALLFTPCPVMQEPTPTLGSPFKSPPHSSESNSLSIYSSLPSPDEVVLAARAAKVTKFNQTVKWLREHIPEDLTELRKQIEHVTNIQKARNNHNTTMSRTVSFWTFSPVKPKPGIKTDDAPLLDGPNIDEYGNLLRTETKTQRITRLRNEGWRTGLRSKNSLWKGPEYYEKLCETVLSELGESRGLTVEGHAHLREWQGATSGH
ncbi:hypothetical protein N7452_010284 [Penicillium brevicompactum]|uniref:Uncharacterized protein n=1 Tax=Penicillium brevicompactum TaxID=5074 RepID=A0A9W9QA18_PENBR|nr:hypothetical protein N7452_010284 [Penicillium brevicompactum]